MFANSVDRSFRKFQRSGDAKALAFVFDVTAPELQRFARFLACPESSTEDLLQSTYLTAIESKQRFDKTQRVLPWLIGILVNHAHEARRRSRRVIDPQRVRTEVGLDPSDEASASELSQSLDQAIARLPEAHRAVLRLYLQHGLEPAEIARSLERPQGTVRAQLSRGLKQLRQLLPASVLASQAYAFVSATRLAEIRASVLAKCGGASVPVASGAMLLGFFAMTLNKKLLLTAAVLLAAFLSYTYRRELLLDGSAKSESNVVRAEVEPKTTSAAAPAQPLSESRTPAPLPDAAADSQSAPAPTTGSLLVHVTDGDDHPLSNVGIEVCSFSQFQNPGRLINFLRTDATGSLLVEGLQPARYAVDVDRMPLQGGAADVAAGKQQELVVRLRGLRVTGSVIDEHGTPAGDALIWAHSNRLDPVELAKSDASGTFSIEHVSPFFELQARKAGFAPSIAHPVRGNDGGSWQVQLVLGGPASEVSGRVLDPEGFPVSGALVAIALETPDSAAPFFPTLPQQRAVHACTDAAGLFRIQEVPRGAVSVTAVGPNTAWLPASASIQVEFAAQHLELQLGVAATLEGKITRNGKPLARCRISVRGSAETVHTSYIIKQLANRDAVSDAEGQFRIVSILPGEVQVRAVYQGNEVFGQQTILMLAGETRRQDLEYSASKRILFEITLEPAESPVKDDKWLVCVWSGEETDASFLSQAADRNGRVQFNGLADGHYTAAVYCQPEMGDLLMVLGAEFDAREGRLALQIPAERMRLQPVRGRVLDATGGPLNARTVQAHSLEPNGAITLQRATGADGAFAFAGLPPGRYVMKLIDGEETKLLREFTVAGDHPEDLGDLTDR